MAHEVDEEYFNKSGNKRSGRSNYLGKRFVTNAPVPGKSDIRTRRPPGEETGDLLSF
jgi:hypothetical protein